MRIVLCALSVYVLSNGTHFNDGFALFHMANTKNIACNFSCKIANISQFEQYSLVMEIP